jgi:hypothetical protein
VDSIPKTSMENVDDLGNFRSVVICHFKGFGCDVKLPYSGLAN